MMSTVPAFSFAEPGLVNRISDFQTGFTPWNLDCSDLFSVVIQSSLKPVVPSPSSGESNTGYVKLKTGFHVRKSGSDESCIDSINTKPDSDELDSENTIIRMKLNRPVLEMTDDDRKRKRMESNRESAKRSRKRKQRHIQNLRDEVNRLGLENRQLGNRLRVVLYHIEQMRTENNRLFSEQEILGRRFSEMRQILILRQLQNQQQWTRDEGRMIVTQQSPFIIDHQMI